MGYPWATPGPPAGAPPLPPSFPAPGLRSQNVDTHHIVQTFVFRSRCVAVDTHLQTRKSTLQNNQPKLSVCVWGKGGGGCAENRKTSCNSRPHSGTRDDGAHSCLHQQFPCLSAIIVCHSCDFPGWAAPRVCLTSGRTWGSRVWRESQPAFVVVVCSDQHSVLPLVLGRLYGICRGCIYRFTAGEAQLATRCVVLAASEERGQGQSESTAGEGVMRWSSQQWFRSSSFSTKTFFGLFVLDAVRASGSGVRTDGKRMYSQHLFL